MTPRQLIPTVSVVGAAVALLGALPFVAQGGVARRSGQILALAQKCAQPACRGLLRRSSLIQAKTGSSRRIASIAGSATFSADGRRLAFIQSTAATGPASLVVARWDGANRRVLARAPAQAWIGGYAWGLGGRVVYTIVTHDANGVVTDSRVFLARADGDGRRDITPPRTDPVSAYSVPTWSPNGRTIGFYRFQGELGTATCCSGTYEVMRPDGSGIRRLFRSNDPAHGTPWVSWSPDSNRLAAVLGERPATPIVIDARTARIRPLKRFLSTSYGQPTWSPDGRWIAFQTTLVRADGSSARRLAQGRQCERGGAWSPDGSEIVFACGKRMRIGPNVEVLSNEVRSFPVSGGDGELVAAFPRGWEITEIQWR